MKKISLKSFSDPGHGWLKCNRKLLKDLGIMGQISRFSYQRNDDVFLEEDCDAGVLITALQARGVAISIKHHSGNKSSRIRNYWPYRLREGEG